MSSLSTPADPVAREAARWFAQLARAAPDDPVRGRFEAWLASSPRHAEEYARFAELWDDFDSDARLARLTGAVESRRLSAREQTAEGRRRALKIGGVMALGLAGLFGWQAWRGQERDDGAVATLRRSSSRGQALEQQLADGSHLTLAPESSLAVRIGRGRREVWLERGEAIFEVSADAARPFVVAAAGLRVTVLGTGFVVARLPDDSVRVSVLHGRVRLERESGAPAQGLILGKGDVGELDADAAAVPRRVERSAADADSWRHGVLVFEADRLSDVVQRLSRHASRPLRLDDGVATAARVTAVVQLRDVDAFVQSLPRVAPVRIVEGGDGWRVVAAPEPARGR